MKGNLYLIIFSILFSFMSCEKEEVGKGTIVLTEDILFISGENIRLSGRIIEVATTDVSDHGFEISRNDEFNGNEIIKIELGERTKKGQFIGESNGLEINTNYWYRAYLVEGNQYYYGKTKSFSTLNVSVSSFEPAYGYAGSEMKIVGSNFSSNTKVYFGDREAEIIDIELESIMKLKIPEIDDSATEYISVVVNDESTTFNEPFEYIYGVWNEVENVTFDRNFHQALSMEVGDEFLLGLGFGKLNSSYYFNSKIYRKELATPSWTEVPFSGSYTTYPFYNSGGYFGGGALLLEGGPSMVKEFWHYKNGTITSLGEMKYGFYQAVSFYINDVVYVLGGINDNNEENIKLYSYDTQKRSWSVIRELNFEINSILPHFLVGDTAYFLTSKGELHTYNFTTNETDLISLFPSNIITGSGVCTLIGDKAYIGLFEKDSRIWEYDIEGNTWKVKYKFQGDLQDNNSGYYSYNNKLYVIRMSEQNNAGKMKIWEFSPEQLK